MSGLATLGPLGVYSQVGAGVTQVVGANSNRNGLIFINSSVTVTIWLAPINLRDPNGNIVTLQAGIGIPLLPQGDYKLLPIPGGMVSVGFGSAWVATTGGGGTANILVLELFGG